MYKTDILFTGFYGYCNTGDDAFIEVSAWGAKKFWNKDNVRFLARKNNLPQTLISTKAYPFVIPKTFSLQLDLLLRNTDYLISAGGSTIHSKMSKLNPKMKALRLKNKGGNIKLGAIGVSVGPFKTISDERAIKEYLQNLNFLAVRDQASYNYVSSLNLPYTPVNSFDLAALLPEVYEFTKKNDVVERKKIVGISVCPYESLQNDLNPLHEKLRNEKIVNLIKYLDKEENIQFRFYIINGNDRIGDYNLTMNTINQASPKYYEVVNYNRNTQQIWTSIAECDFIISTRLHAAIFACFSNIPFMLNEYHRKCSDFLENIGYDESYRLYNNDYDVKNKAMQIIEIINEKHKYRYPKYLSKMKDRARLNFTAIPI